MEKQEFLDRLRLSINGKVAPEVLNETMEYYEEYINNQVRLGTDQSQVMESLGDPRLIARTIIETKGQVRSGNGDFKEKENEYGENTEVRRKHPGIPGWVWLILFFFILFSILAFIFRVLIKLAPLLIIVAVVIYFSKKIDN